MKRAARWVVTLALVAGASGCATLEYYASSVRGQLALLAARQPIDTLIADPLQPSALRARLAAVRRMREFADRALGLPDGGSFRDYVALDREHVVWTVVATPELSLEPRRWCFPVVGCVNYRGYFSRAAAQRFASRLGAAGFDVHVAGVDAYSTLGWFDDPLPSTLLGLPDHRLAGVVFHELAHQRLYVGDDSTFNESFAVVVEREGVRRWLAAQGSGRERAAYAAARARSDEFLALLREVRARLARLYDSAASDQQKRAGKGREFVALRRAYARMRQRWGDAGGYDAWFARPLNNARLALVATYDGLVPQLAAILARLDGNLPALYRACASLRPLSPAARRERLHTWAAGGGDLAVAAGSGA